jgi:hypothetical protein
MADQFSSENKEINVAEIMKDIRRKISEKKGTVYTDEEIRDLAEMKLKAMIGAGDVESGLISLLHQNAGEWNISQEALYASHPGFYGRLIRKARQVLHPVLKLFANPDHIVHKQAKLNLNLTHIVHNLVLELTRLNLEHNELRQRFDSLSRKIEWMDKRQKTLEKLVHPGKAPPPHPSEQ